MMRNPKWYQSATESTRVPTTNRECRHRILCRVAHSKYLLLVRSATDSPSRCRCGDRYLPTVRGAPQTKQALPESTRKVKRAAGGGAVCLASGGDLVLQQPGEQGVKPERVPRALDRYCGRCLQVHVELLHGVAVMAQAVPPQLPCRRVQHCHAVVSRMQVHLKSIVITWSSSPSHGVGPTTVSPCGRWMLAIKRGRHMALLPFTGEHLRVSGMVLR